MVMAEKEGKNNKEKKKKAHEWAKAQLGSSEG